MQRPLLISHGLIALAVLAGVCGTAAPSPAAAPEKSAEKKLTYEQKKDVIYADSDGVAFCMDIFTPTGPKNGVGIIDIASGAWHSDRGKIRDHMRGRFYDIFCGRGYTVFAIRPGSISRFSIPDMIKHLRVGTKWVQDHAGEYGIDPHNLGLTGASAGGHLSALLVVSTAAGKDGKVDQPFKAVGIFFPPTNFLNFRGSEEDFGKSERTNRFIRSLAVDREQADRKLDVEKLRDLAKQISPALLVDRQQPPFLVIHGDADPVVPLQQSELLVEALKKQGGSAELIIKKGGGHAWLTIPEEVKVMADWFDKHLLNKTAKHE
jgi:acetyl esterase/lipase